MSLSQFESVRETPAIDSIKVGAHLAFRGVRMRFGRNEEIFGEGEPVEYVYSVVSGAVRTMRFSSDGRRQILSFHLPGDLFGLELGAAHGFSAETVVAAEIVMVRRAQLEKATTEDPRAMRAWLDITAQTLLDAREHALVLGRKGANERVAAFLVTFADRFGSSAGVDLPMSRTDIADYLGLTIESVSRAFSEMERQHAIDLPTSRRVVMRDRSLLLQREAA
ncbi:MAG: helix-turn-helix domain-containing protein [Pseudomonadota bacterium]